MRDMADKDGLGSPVPDQEKLDRLSRSATSLGYEIVEVSGFIDHIDGKASGQTPILVQARSGVEQILAANRAVIEALDAIRAST